MLLDPQFLYAWHGDFTEDDLLIPCEELAPPVSADLDDRGALPAGAGDPIELDGTGPEATTVLTQTMIEMDIDDYHQSLSGELG